MQGNHQALQISKNITTLIALGLKLMNLLAVVVVVASKPYLKLHDFVIDVVDICTRLFMRRYSWQEKT